MRLSNVIMQLRKVASHPFLFDWPIDYATGQPVVNKNLVEASGKMLLLNRLLDALFARKHKVLLFSQFTSMLDIIEVRLLFLSLSSFTDKANGRLTPTTAFLGTTPCVLQDWATEFKGLKICRIDGNTKQAERQRQMNEFNNAGEEDGVCRLFILSTRAGGLGINLVAADTVIFCSSLSFALRLSLSLFVPRARTLERCLNLLTRPPLVSGVIDDQDWNPQMDLQAQDRAHRIGQKRPVLIFRLVTAHTVEEKILKKAGAKRRLEAMVIADGKFKGGVGQEKRVSAIDEATALLKLEGDKIDLVDAGDKIIAYVFLLLSLLNSVNSGVEMLTSRALFLWAITATTTSRCCSTDRPRRTVEPRAGTLPSRPAGRSRRQKSRRARARTRCLRFLRRQRTTSMTAWPTCATSESGDRVLPGEAWVVWASVLDCIPIRYGLF